ncbi:MAG: DnaA/Hda family protein [Candidatus Poseidoniaceae archaeon]|jgi:chromosomal replication initiation ATPase DnaA|nr:DnaA/Hda family protein [Candidatus Poseidoniaceae archaeon]
MTNSRSERLKLAMAGARNALGREDTDGRLALSPLYRLRGIMSTDDPREGDLLSRTNVRERPVYDSIANQILGTNSEFKSVIKLDNNDHDSLSEIAAHRLASLRDRQIPQPIDNEVLGSSIGIMSDGKPVWADILDEQRGYATNDIKHAYSKADFTPTWPPLLTLSTNKTWQNWHVIDENLKASIAAEKVVDAPGTTLNPLLIVGDEGVGRSHLISACAQGMIRRGDGNVHLINSAAISGLEKLPDGWQDSMAHATMLAVDDLHLIKGDLASEFGMMIDLALNHGVQIVCTSRKTIDELSNGRLWEIMRSAVTVRIHMPSKSSLMTHLRKSSSGRSLLLSDEMLAQIVSSGDGDWRSTDSAFEKVALAFDAGEEILDSRDISRILAGEIVARSESDIILERESLKDLADRVVGEALDVVYTKSDIGGVDLHVPIAEIVDDWEVPDITPSENDELIDRLTDQALLPHVDHTLTVDERDQFLIERTSNLDGFDSVRARETTASIDHITEDMFENSQLEQQNEALMLAELEEEMFILAEKSKGAGVDELINIADRLQEIDLELKYLDDYTPEGEWHINADNVDMSDLVGNKPVLSKLTPVTVLSPSGEEE